MEDAARLLSTAAAEDAELGLFLRLAVVLGARRGELCALRWSEVDLDQGEVLIAGAVVRVPHKALLAKPTKTHAKRRVAVGAGTVEELRARRIAQAKDALACGTTLAADAYLFSHVPDGSAPLDPDGISHRFQRLARRLGVRCRLHDLRHFMVTQLVAGGVDWRTVSGRAGHADGHMTLVIYAHFQQAQDRQAAEFMDELLVAADRQSAKALAGGVGHGSNQHQLPGRRAQGRPLPQPPLRHPRPGARPGGNPPAADWLVGDQRPRPDPGPLRLGAGRARSSVGPVAPGREGQPDRIGPIPQRPGLLLCLWPPHPGGPLGPRAGPHRVRRLRPTLRA